MCRHSFCFKGLAQLEREISYLGGMCAASLMKKDIVLPPITAEEMEEDLDLVDEGAQQVCNFTEQSSMMWILFPL